MQKKNIMLSVVAMLTLFGGIVSYSYSRHSDLKSGFVINYNFWEHGNLTAVVKRQVKRSGEFLEETTYTNGKRHSLVGTQDGGAGLIDPGGQKLNYIGGAFIAQDKTMEQARKNAGSGYVRDDVLLGYDVVVSERCQEDRSYCTTFWEAPQLGGTVLRREESAHGEVHILMDAVAVTLGEPGFTVPDYPVDKTRFEQRQKEAQKQ